MHVKKSDPKQLSWEKKTELKKQDEKRSNNDQRERERKLKAEAE